jgi:hypothetical protein
MSYRSGRDRAASAFVRRQGQGCCSCRLLLPLPASESPDFHQDLALGHLQHGRGLLLRAVGQVVAVDGDYLEETN